MSESAAAIEMGFFQALRDSGIELKVAMTIYHEVVTTMVKEGAFRLRAPKVPEVNIHAGRIHPESGMGDILGKPGLDVPPPRRVTTSGETPIRLNRGNVNAASGMKDELDVPAIPESILARMRERALNYGKDLNKAPSRTSTTVSLPSLAGAAAAGTGAGIAGKAATDKLTSEQPNVK